MKQLRPLKRRADKRLPVPTRQHFVVGSMMRLRGLPDVLGLNGETCTIEKWDPFDGYDNSGLYVVRLRSGLGKKVTHAELEQVHLRTRSLKGSRPLVRKRPAKQVVPTGASKPLRNKKRKLILV